MAGQQLLEGLPHGRHVVTLQRGLPVDADRHLDVLGLPVAEDAEADPGPDRRDRHEALEILRRLDRGAVERDHDIVGAEPAARGGLARHDLADHGAARLLEVERRQLLVADLADAHAQPAPLDLALLGELRQELLQEVRWDREADGAVASRHAVDADDLAGHVDQGAAGVARVDRGVGLDEVEPRRGDGERRALAAHDPERDGLLEAERMAQRQHELADPHAVRVAEGQHGQVARAVDPDQGEIDPVVLAGDLAHEPPTVGHPDLDGVTDVDDVGVRHEQAGRVDEEARTGATAGLARRLRLLARGRAAAPSHADLDERRLESLGELAQQVVEAGQLRRRLGLRRLRPERRVGRQGGGGAADGEQDGRNAGDGRRGREHAHQALL